MATSVYMTRYVGSGIARSLTSFGFLPTVAWTHGVDNYTEAPMSHAGIQPNQSVDISGVDGLRANCFTSFDVDGVSLGTDVEVNDNTFIYYLAAFAGANVEYGTYAGTGVAQTIGLGITAGLVLVTPHAKSFPTRYQAVMRHKSMGAGLSYPTGSGLSFANGITAIGASFTVDVNVAVNQNLQNYSYIAFKDGDDILYGSYGGDGPQDRLINVGAQPRFILVIPVDAGGLSDWTCYKYDNMPGVHSALFNGSGGGGTDDLYNYYIRARESSGFRVGSDGVGTILNQSGWTYYWMAIAAIQKGYTVVF